MFLPLDVLLSLYDADERGEFDMQRRDMCTLMMTASMMMMMMMMMMTTILKIVHGKHLFE
jgi:hypothetical protein